MINIKLNPPKSIRCIFITFLNLTKAKAKYEKGKISVPGDFSPENLTKYSASKKSLRAFMFIKKDWILGGFYGSFSEDPANIIYIYR